MNETQTIKIADIIVGDRLRAIVDEEDVKWLNLFKWSLNAKGYPQARIKISLFEKVGIPWCGVWTMHNAILAKHKLLIYGSLDVDHINRNRLDNRKGNLRQITRSENLRNTKRHDNKIDRYNRRRKAA